VFLLGLMATLEAAPEHLGEGRFSREPVAAMRAFSRIYAGWGLSQDFYRADLHRTALGAPDLETFLRTGWEERFGRRAAANLYAQLRTWDAADISANPMYGGDLARALEAIRARVLLMPGETDLYFRVADNAAELPHLARAELRPIPSIWGHRAGNPARQPRGYRVPAYGRAGLDGGLTAAPAGRGRRNRREPRDAGDVEPPRPRFCGMTEEAPRQDVGVRCCEAAVGGAHGGARQSTEWSVGRRRR
jgi:hypothetical protein